MLLHPGRNWLRISCFMIATLVMSVAAAAQSEPLGDVARQNREKKAAEDSSSTPPVVITNKNLPKAPESDAGAEQPTASDQPANADQPKSPFGAKGAGSAAQGQANGQQRARWQAEDRQATQQRAYDQRAAALWKKRIQDQEALVANLRLRVDRLKATIRFTDQNHNSAGSYDYYSALNYDRGESLKLQRLAQLEEQLSVQRQRLEEMQDAARHSGAHTPTYDP